MEFYFPDSQDQVDPNYDFASEEHPPFHVRQRDDRYAHEIHSPAPYSGILVSKTMVDGYHTAGRYTAAQRHRLYRLGMHRFFRLPAGLKVMGDCGGFSYHQEDKPPVTVSEVIDFYEGTGVNEGVSVDHVILGFQDDSAEQPIPAEWIERQDLTLKLAAEFYTEHQRRDCRFGAMGAAQGWSPQSYADSVEALQEIGYQRIALGGMAPLRAMQIISCLEAIDAVRSKTTSLHLLGVSRTEHYTVFNALGVESLDSTSPFRQAFKDDKDNYYALDEVPTNYVALRIPPSETNRKLQDRIRAGQLDQHTVRTAERRALEAVRAYDAGGGTRNAALSALIEYEQLVDSGKRDHTEAYRLILDKQPWKECPCEVCRRWGVEVAIFRGTERNKRRGFHNLWVFNQRMQGHIAGAPRSTKDTTSKDLISDPV